MHRSEVDVIAAGLNHQTWFIKVEWRGIDMLPKLLEAVRAHPSIPDREGAHRCAAPLWLLQHRVERPPERVPALVPQAPGRDHAVDRPSSSWINGETGGYLRVCTEGRNWFETDFPNWLEGAPLDLATYKRSEEHGSYIIEALETGRTYRGHFNVVNRGHITNLPDGCVVEIPGYVDRTGINMPVVGDLPLACAATCSVSARVQEMAWKRPSAAT
jgi:alpha-galactosidase